MSKPTDLGPAGKRFFRTVTRDFELEGHALRLLEEACRSLDRAEEARAAVEADGAYLKDRFGQVKAHPGIAVERDHRGLFARLVRELGLPLDGAPDTRPPLLKGRYAHRE